MRKSFTKWAMDIAQETKTRSTCISRQVGALIIKDKQIIATGYNGAASGCLHCTDIGYCERKKREIPSGQGLEICRAGHAESNAIDQCAKHGISCKDGTLYSTTQPCVFCTIRIIQSGIKKVIFKGEYPTGLATQLFKESGVELIKYEQAIEDEELNEREKQEKISEQIIKFNNTLKNY